MIDKSKTYFKIFKVSDITKIAEQELKRRYRILALKYHPDKGGSHEKFLLAKEAYDYLVVERQTYLKQKVQKVQFKVSEDNKFYFYGDGSIFDIKKNRWKQYKKHEMWYIWNYEYIQQLDEVWRT